MKKSKNSGFLLSAISAALVAIGSLFYWAAKKMESSSVDLSDIPIEDVDGIVRLEDIVAWLKSLNLQAEKDTPFIIDGDRVKEILKQTPDLSGAVLAGVYEEAVENIKSYKAFRGVAFDKKLKDVLSHATQDNPLVVLS